jgi:arabinan endo-1,5-alpha-L-arabinosidase
MVGSVLVVLGPSLGCGSGTAVHEPASSGVSGGGASGGAGNSDGSVDAGASGYAAESTGAGSGGTVGATNSGSTGTTGARMVDAGRAGSTPSGDAGVDASQPLRADAGAVGGGGQDAGAGDASFTEGGVGCGGQVLGGGPVTTNAMHLDIGVHDPSMIWDGSRYFLFATGGTLGIRSSPDMFTWTNAGNVFSAVPAWVATALGSIPTDLWAPDISYFNGLFHVYYAGSSFGSNDSVIGLATTTSLESPAFSDRGMVVQSTTSDDFNAIDPNVSFDQDCGPWLAYGSFWSGIKLHKLDAATGKLATDDTNTYSLAARGGSNAIEAASIVSHNGYYYLFVSFDACCKGLDSTYRTMMGRATQITGPYTDKTGASMMTGAAEQLLVTSGRYIGPGGGTAWKDGDQYLYVYHYYDGDDSGVSKLQVRPIAFDDDDWVSLGAPLFP